MSNKASPVCYFSWLPSEVLSVVTNSLGGAALASLFRSCNKSINNKLCTVSGVNAFDLYLPKCRLLRTSPSVITRFQGLRVLKIELTKDVGSAPTIGTDFLKQLPSGIVEIIFQFREAEECWLRPSGRQNKGSFVRNHSNPFFDFASVFPNLMTLKLVAPSPHQNLIPDGHPTDDAPTPIYGLLPDEALSLLPSSLTCLELPSNNIISQLGWENIPKSVIKLNLEWLGDLREETLPVLLNLELQELNLSRCAFKFPKDFLKSLPATLKYLDLKMVKTFEINSEFFFPRQLEHLDLTFCNTFHAAYIEHLPRGLTRLDLDHLNFKLEIEHLTQLPPNLTHLSLHASSFAAPIEDSFALLPRSLRFLGLGGNTFEGLHDQHLEHLPRGLTHLDLSNHTKLTDKCFTYMPPSIVNLLLYSNTELTAAAAYHFPRSLYNISLRFLRKLFTRIDQMQGFKHQDELISILREKGITSNWVSLTIATDIKHPPTLMWLNENGYKIK